MSLREQVNEAYKAAMKARDDLSVQTLRLLLSDLKKIEIDERRVVTEEEVLAALRRGIKKRNETIDIARQQGRPELAKSEADEIKILERFLPQQLSESELLVLVAEAIAEVGASTKKDQGRVMAALIPKIQGRADGKAVSKAVSERLS